MAVNPHKKRYTFEQYLMLLQNGDRRLEYDHGEITFMAGSSANHAAISANMWRELDDALGDDATCRAYVADRVVRLTPELSFMPDVVVTCDISDQGEAFLLESPHLVVEVLSRSTEARDRTYKLLQYQAKASLEEIVFISQYSQHVEVITRTPDGWHYAEYGHDQTIKLESLDIEIEVARIYRRLNIPIEVDTSLES